MVLVACVRACASCVEVWWCCPCTHTQGGFQAEWASPAAAGCNEDCDRMNERQVESGSAAWVSEMMAFFEATLEPGDVLAVVTAETKFPHSSPSEALERT